MVTWGRLTLKMSGSFGEQLERPTRMPLDDGIISFRLPGIPLNWGVVAGLLHDGVSWGARKLSFLFSFDSHVSYIQ